MRARFVAEAPLQAEAMLATVEQRHPGSLSALRDDPLGVLGSWTEVQLSFAPDAGGGDRCSVTGHYQYGTNPPTLVIGTSRSAGRRAFTALHELGHHLQQTDPVLGQRLFARQDTEAFEEAACDAFAARVLLPTEDMTDRIPARGPTAPSVTELVTYFQASREACCVRAAEYLTGAGAVVLLDATGTVVFAAPHGMIPPARQSDQSSTPLIASVLRTGATVERDETFVVFGNGSRSDTLYGQATWCDSLYIIAVLAEDNPGWRAFAPPRPNTGSSWFGRWWTCETCDISFRVPEPACDRCHQPRCTDGHCGCTAARTTLDRRCDTCFLILAPSRFDRDSTTCRDCA
jgi:hypothetical protein